MAWRSGSSCSASPLPSSRLLLGHAEQHHPAHARALRAGRISSRSTSARDLPQAVAGPRLLLDALARHHEVRLHQLPQGDLRLGEHRANGRSRTQPTQPNGNGRSHDEDLGVRGKLFAADSVGPAWRAGSVPGALGRRAQTGHEHRGAREARRPRRRSDERRRGWRRRSPSRPARPARGTARRFGGAVTSYTRRRSTSPRLESSSQRLGLLGGVEPALLVG